VKNTGLNTHFPLKKKPYFFSFPPSLSLSLSLHCELQPCEFQPRASLFSLSPHAMNSSQQLTVDEVILSSAPLSLSSLTLIDTCWQQINIKNFSTAQCFLLSHSQSRHNFSLTEIISLFFSHNVVFHLHKYNVIFLYFSVFSLTEYTP
jgi:hypothetical protein